jgi:FKBP-type peptidyl-prolyl cis-trans isomerase FkpA
MHSLNKAKHFPAFLVIILFFVQCNRNDLGNKLKNPGQYKEPLIKANQEAVKEESLQIDDFIRRHKWEMETTSTGLRIMITKHGLGPNSVEGKAVKLSYTVTLLTGDTVYTALKDGPLIFDIGKGQVISGLEEAILLLRVGDRAKIIIPSHLAYGLIGDQKKILQKASLVYDIEFISMF